MGVKLKLSKAIEIVDAAYTYHLNIETILKKLPQAVEVILDAPLSEELTLMEMGQEAALAQQSVDLFNQYFFDGPIETLENKLEQKLKTLAARLPRNMNALSVNTREGELKVSLEGAVGYNFLTETFKRALEGNYDKGLELRQIFKNLSLDELLNDKRLLEVLLESGEFEEVFEVARNLKEILFEGKMVMVSYDVEGSYIEPWHTLMTFKDNTFGIKVDGLKVLVCTPFEALMVLTLNGKHERELIIESTFLLDFEDPESIEMALELIKSGGLYAGALNAFNAAKALS